MTKVFISAGEATGDLHAAALTRAILQQDPTAQVFGMGGDALAAAGGQVAFNYKDYSVMGFVEVLQALPRLLGLKTETICRMEKGHNPASLRRLQQFADLYGCTVIDLLQPPRS